MKIAEEKRNTLLSEVKLAAFLTGTYFVTRFTLGLLLRPSLSETAALGVVFFGYLFSMRCQRISTATRSAILALTFVLLVAASGIINTFGICLLGLLIMSLTRSVLRPSSLFILACDFAFTIGSFSMAAFVNTRNGDVLAVWTFFLLQCFASFLPKRRRFERPEVKVSPDEQNFARAFGTAESALRRVIATAGE